MLLVELMLAAHPDIGFGGDFDYAISWSDSEYAEYAEWPPLIPYWQHLALSPRLRELGLKIDPALGFADLVRSLLAQQRGATAWPFGVAAHGRYDRLLRLWPRARFVYVSRATSREAVAREAASLRESDRSWRKIAAQIEQNRRLELRYETLLANLPTELARVCGFLGVSFDPGMLSLPVRAASTPDAALLEGARPAGRAGGANFASGLGKRFAQLLGG